MIDPNKIANDKKQIPNRFHCFRHIFQRSLFIIKQIKFNTVPIVPTRYVSRLKRKRFLSGIVENHRNNIGKCTKKASPQPEKPYILNEDSNLRFRIKKTDSLKGLKSPTWIGRHDRADLSQAHDIPPHPLLYS